MAKLIYVTNVSLDGYIEDAHGGFEWTEPNDEVFTFITDLVRPAVSGAFGEGKPAFPSDARVQLDLLEEYRFASGVVNLRYRSAR